MVSKLIKKPLLRARGHFWRRLRGTKTHQRYCFFMVGTQTVHVLMDGVELHTAHQSQL